MRWCRRCGWAGMPGFSWADALLVPPVPACHAGVAAHCGRLLANTSSAKPHLTWKPCGPPLATHHRSPIWRQQRPPSRSCCGACGRSSTRSSRYASHPACCKCLHHSSSSRFSRLIAVQVRGRPLPARLLHRRLQRVTSLRAGYAGFDSSSAGAAWRGAAAARAAGCHAPPCRVRVPRGVARPPLRCTSCCSAAAAMLATQRAVHALDLLPSSVALQRWIKWWAAHFVDALLPRTPAC